MTKKKTKHKNCISCILEIEMKKVQKKFTKKRYEAVKGNPYLTKKYNRFVEIFNPKLSKSDKLDIVDAVICYLDELRTEREISYQLFGNFNGKLLSFLEDYVATPQKKTKRKAS